MIIIFDKETKEIGQVIWSNELPEGLELGSNERYLMMRREIDEHRLHKCLIRLDDAGRLAEVLSPIKVRVIANKPNIKVDTPILQDVLYFEMAADGVDELTLSLELEEEIPAWVKKKLLEQKIRVWRSVDGEGEESYVEASRLKDHTVSLKSAEPREWVFSFNNWMIEPVSILVRAR